MKKKSHYKQGKPMPPHKEVLRIKTLNLACHGVAKNGGHIYEVPFTLPGETVAPEVLEERGATRYALPKEIIKKSSHRIISDCKHFGTCGACHLRHLKYRDTVQLKTELLIAPLRQLGVDIEKVLQPSIVAPKPYGYRNNVRFYMRDGQLKQKKMLSHQEFEVEECHVMSKAVLRMVKALQKDLPSSVSEIEIRENSKGQHMVTLTSEATIVSNAGVHSLYWYNPVDKKYTHLLGETMLRHTLDIRGERFTFDIGPDSFFQVNTEVAELLFGYVSTLVPKQGLLYDLYAGTGTMGIIMKKAFPDLEVVSVEISKAMVEQAKHNASCNEVSGIKYHQEDVRSLSLRERPDCLIVDPPRNGLGEESITHILSLSPKKLIYVSCSPRTFLEDAKMLLENYELRSLRYFDMMPFTSHGELLGEFVMR